MSKILGKIFSLLKIMKYIPSILNPINYMRVITEINRRFDYIYTGYVFNSNVRKVYAKSDSFSKYTISLRQKYKGESLEKLNNIKLIIENRIKHIENNYINQASNIVVVLLSVILSGVAVVLFGDSKNITIPKLKLFSYLVILASILMMAGINITGYIRGKEVSSLYTQMSIIDQLIKEKNV